jgi:lipopolysaccharide transport system permease protein
MSDANSGHPLRYYGQSDPMGLGQLVEGWQARELLYSFFMRDLLIRYRQVFVGVVWVLVQPLLSTMIFLGLFFVMGANGGADGTQALGEAWKQAPVLLVGMLLWQMVNNSLRDATGSLVNYRHVVTKIYFPRMLLPLSCLLCAVFDLLVGSLLVLPICGLTGVPVMMSTVWAAPLGIGLLVLFCFGCILWLSALNAHYRDVGYALPFVLQIGMFVSPVVYASEKLRSLLSPWGFVLYEANPIATSIGWVRWAVFGLPMPSVAAVLGATVITLLMVVTGLAWFQRANQWIADRI